MKIRLLYTLVFLCLIIIGCKKNNIKKELNTNLDKNLTLIIKKVMKEHAIPGLSLGVVKDNKLVFVQGFGYENLHSKKPVTKNTIFHLASISKTFVSTAIMQLVEQGKIDLDEKVTMYLPYFKMADMTYKEVTIRQMLSHNSGMPNSNDYEWTKPQYDEKAIERFVKSLSKEKMELKPGEKFRYSNIAYEVLGDVIAKVSGKSFAEYQKENILNPSGMKKSSFLKPNYLPKNWASPHAMTLAQRPLNMYPYNRRHAPSSTMHSNAVEMANYAIMHLNKGTFNGEKILTKETYKSTWKTNVKIDDGQLKKYNMGLGWFLGNFNNYTTVLHGGSDDGFQAHFVLVPEKSIGVVVMVNTLPAPVEEITNQVIGLLLNEKTAPIKPLASILMWKVLKEKGEKEAITFWNDLKSNQSEKYNFDLQQFFNLYFTIQHGTKDEAKKIATVCKSILNKKDIDFLKGITQYSMKQTSDDSIAKEVLKILND